MKTLTLSRLAMPAGGSRSSSALVAFFPLAFLVLLVAISAVVAPNILSVRALVNFLTDAAPLLILVVGGTLPILSGSVDLSVAGVAAITGVLIVKLYPVLGIYSLPVVLLLAFGFGAVQGIIQAKLQIPSFITTLATLSVLTGLALLLSNATAQPLPDGDPWIDWVSKVTMGIPNSIIVVLVCVAILGSLMHFTRFGRDLYALGSGERTALMSGVNVLKVRCLSFAISALFAAIGGALLVSITGFSSPTIAGNLLLLSIVGVVLGGTAISGGVGGIVPGLIGGLITSWLRIFTVIIGVAPTAQNIVFGAMALIAVALTTDRKKIGVIK